MNSIVLDAWAWFEIFHGTKRGDRIRVAHPPETRSTSAIAIAEVASRLHRDGLLERADSAVAVIRGESRIIQVDDDIAALAGQLHAHLRRRTPDASLADAIHLATARTLGLPLLSADPCFEGEPDVVRA